MAVKQRVVLGWYEIASGGAGIVLMIWAASHASADLPGGAWYSMGPFVLLVLAGTQLLRGHGEGVRLSVALQLGQVLFFSVGGVVWKFIAGLQASVWITAERSYAKVGVEATLLAGRGASNEPILLGINIVPVIVVYLLWKVMRETVKQPPK